MTYIVMTVSAHMPSSVKAPYKRVAVVQVADPTVTPKMISTRAKGVVRIVETWERLHARGVDTAFARALAEARGMASALNAAEAWERV